MNLEVVAAVGFGLAVWLFMGSSRKPSRLSRLTSNASEGESELANEQTDPKRQQRVTLAACGVAGLAVILLIGGVLGVVLAVAIVALGPKVLGSFETKSARVRRELILSDAPLVAELLASSLQAGVSDQRALRSVAASLNGPVVEELGMVQRALALGTDPVQAWGMLDSDSPLAPISRAFARSAQSGAPLSALLASVGQELRSKHAAAVEAAARSVAVKSVAPLGLCFLPAFILLGVVPLVASLFAQVAPF